MTEAVPPIAKPPAIRWIAVLLCIIYGFAKLNGSQFTILDSELARPMGEVSGFWLTWYYFGYSPIYGSFIALVQVVGALLLAWPRTALLGALLLVPVIGNIILIDVFYSVDAGATVVAMVIFACLLAVVLPHTGRLVGVVLLDRRASHPALRTVVLLVTLGGACGFTYWVANYNNRFPTRIDGAWRVIAQSGAAPAEWRQVFFEHNRAFLVVFRSATGDDVVHHFEIDGQGVVRIWDKWLEKGELLMQGQLTADRIELRAAATANGSALVLERQPTSH